ncbi:MAG: porin family protein [Chlorobiaceae bacterium]|nr:porin family protein [Chlorobiaceae bacterium]NTW74622.1 porin family protein [Chlorobiaceae bacterium]
MKKIILMASLLVGLGAAPALAESGPYISGSAGAAFLSDSKINGIGSAVGYDTGYALNAAAGYSFGMARLEGALGYQSNDVDSFIGVAVPNVDANVTVFSVMANGYLDFEFRDLPIKPYVMAGIGIADVNAEFAFLGGKYEDSDTVFACQVGGGVGIEAGSNLTVDIGYRYLSPSKSTIDGVELTVDSHMVMAGLRYNF